MLRTVGVVRTPIFGAGTPFFLKEAEFILSIYLFIENSSVKLNISQNQETNL